MIDFATIENGLKALIATLAAVSANVVTWKDEPRPMARGTQVLLSWTSSVGVGVDEIRFEDPEDDEASHVVPVIVGNRVLALQVQIETWNQKPNAPHARSIAEKIRTRLARPTTFASLKALNLGWIDANVVNVGNYESDQRMIAAAIVDIRFNHAVTDRDEDDETQSTIEHAEVTSQIAGVDGVQVEASLQVVEEVMPPMEEA